MSKDKDIIVCVPGNVILNVNGIMLLKNKKYIFFFIGQRLCVSDKYNIAGPGTYEQQGYIYSKLAGVIKLTQKENVSKKLKQFR